MEQNWSEPNTPLDEEEKRQLVIQMVARLRCVECGRLYSPDDFALIERGEEMWVLSTRCRHCDEVCHVVIYMQLDAEPEALIDLMPDEVTASSEWLPITADDLLDTHAFLQSFDGDFLALFTS
jgi:hypothetical protein